MNGSWGGGVHIIIFFYSPHVHAMKDLWYVLTTADKHGVLLSGEYSDYIHAVSANVSNSNNSATAFIMVAVTVYRDTSRRRLTS